MSINTCTISGNLVDNAELRTTKTGTAVMTFRVAVNDRRRNNDGEWEDYANFFELVMFGTRAETLSNLLTKGLRVAVSGRLHQSTWEAKDGATGETVKRSKINILVDDLEFIGKRDSGEAETEDGTAKPAAKSKKTSAKAKNKKAAAEADEPSDSDDMILGIDDGTSVYDQEIPF